MSLRGSARTAVAIRSGTQLIIFPKTAKQISAPETSFLTRNVRPPIELLPPGRGWGQCRVSIYVPRKKEHFLQIEIKQRLF